MDKKIEIKKEEGVLRLNITEVINEYWDGEKALNASQNPFDENGNFKEQEGNENFEDSFEKFKQQGILRNEVHRAIENALEHEFNFNIDVVDFKVEINGNAASFLQVWYNEKEPTGESYCYNILKFKNTIEIFDSIGKQVYKSLIIEDEPDEKDVPDSLSFHSFPNCNDKMAFHYITDFLIDKITMSPDEWLYSDWCV